MSHSPSCLKQRKQSSIAGHCFTKASFFFWLFLVICALTPATLTLTSLWNSQIQSGNSLHSSVVSWSGSPPCRRLQRLKEQSSNLEIKLFLQVSHPKNCAMYSRITKDASSVEKTRGSSSPSGFSPEHSSSPPLCSDRPIDMRCNSFQKPHEKPWPFFPLLQELLQNLFERGCSSRILFIFSCPSETNSMLDRRESTISCTPSSGGSETLSNSSQSIMASLRLPLRGLFVLNAPILIPATKERAASP
mmetsp:Transcript_6462/g.11245  ORF Transcript_6462/g.11245 Transcript_6462/m.11245 type:complete len:247 (-) Transcript_6462:396-1136(-)